MDLFPTSIELAILAFFAAIVNGAVGYGFSSIVTPIALFWTTNRVLNPALVAVELVVNVTLLVRERHFLAATKVRARPVILGLLPGVVLGSIGLVLVSATSVRIFVYALILPLTVAQLLGYRRHIYRERHLGPFLGAGVGFLYSLTTISGPPLALFWRNQGLSKDEFRCAMAQIRVAEASFTATAYLLLGLYTPTSAEIVPFLIVPVLIGVPLGTLILHRVSRDFFSRLVMAVDGVIVSYGLYSVLVKNGYLSDLEGVAFAAVVIGGVVILAVRVISRLPALLAETERRLLEAPIDSRVPGPPPPP